ncbi:MAG: ribonuclease HII [Lachnospiraceae bacterium]|nr:ribonuclease HII [Lachnospiraceae bacterium]
MAGRSLEAERARLDALWAYERQYADRGLIAGVDEAGRGPLAGPVVAAAVILDPSAEILYINDSKKLSEKKREEIFPEIMEKALAVGVGIVDAARIDEINILQATYEAMRTAVSRLAFTPQLLLNDAVIIPGLAQEQVPLIKGDAKSISIGAASIVAKVTRDRIMREAERLYPQYGFAGHKGYGTAAHIEALRQYGPCPIHRRSFITHFIPKGR